LNVQGSIPTMQQNNMSSLQHGFRCHNHTWWCGMRGFKKRKGGKRERWGYCSKNFTGFTTNPSQLYLICMYMIWWENKHVWKVLNEYRVNIT
jgi:hypothetical protein